MALRMLQIDAFTSTPFCGNPAAVCVLPEPRPDAWMQAVAAEMNVAETAFLLDLRRTISECIAENHYGTMQQLCHEHGLKFTSEAPGIGAAVVADE